ncbi:MAG: MCE family protein [Kiritimatiellae bacterium]|nr:MCE family protein [Kiritimatiellia bacterium]
MKRNGDLFSELVVGVFMVAVIALLAYFTIIISGVDLIRGRERVRATVEFRDVGGLKERDNVVYRGMKVGSVERISLAPESITVTMLVDRDVMLRESYRVSVAALSLLGGNYLLLEEGSGAPLPLETTVFKGVPPADWMRDLGEIARNLNDLTSQGNLRNIVTNFESMSEKLNAVATRVERGEGTLGKLLSTNDQVYVDVAATVASAKTIAGRLERGEGTVGKLLSSDDTVYQDLKKTFAHAAEISDRLAAGEGTLGRLLSKDDAVYRDIQGSVANIKAITARITEGEGLLGKITQDKQMADDASKLLANLKNVSEKLAQGEGTLGKLTSDPELYNEVNGLIKDVRQIVDNYRDTTPISTFAGLVGGAL